MIADRKELGCPGHFIGSHDCLFRRHTRIDADGVPIFSVSTIGDYYPNGKRTEIGYERHFETMVFPLSGDQKQNSGDCGCFEPISWSNIDFARHDTRGGANEGHEAMVRKWMQIVRVTMAADREKIMTAEDQ